MSPSVWIRSSKLAKRGCGTYDNQVTVVLAMAHDLITNLIGCKHDVAILQKFLTEHVGEGMVFLVEGEDDSVGSSLEGS